MRANTSIFSTLVCIFLAGAAMAQDAIDVQVCNRSRDTALVAISYQPMGAGTDDWLNEGWFTVNAGECGIVARTANAYFYGYAEVLGDTSRFWGGNHSLCVEYPGPYEFWRGKSPRCKSHQNAVNFLPLQAVNWGTFTWNLDP